MKNLIRTVNRALTVWREAFKRDPIGTVGLSLAGVIAAGLVVLFLVALAFYLAVHWRVSLPVLCGGYMVYQIVPKAWRKLTAWAGEDGGEL